MKSIHSRIIFSFVMLMLVMVALAVAAFLDMFFLENRVHQGVVVAKLEYAVIEMRLEEKNLFLYGDKVSGGKADQYAASALELLTSEREAIQDLIQPKQLEEFRSGLKGYRRFLDHHLRGDEEASALEKMIRSQGHAVSQIAAGMVENERLTLAKSISFSQWVLAFSILMLAVLVYIVGQILARSVVAPLRRLAKDMAPIAEGRFDRLEIRSEDDEMLAIGRAFNNMLGELDLRRRRMMHSEKLAALGVLVAGVAHELNNPLSNISSTAQLLLEEADSADRAQLAEWAGSIDGETERVRRIVQTLREYGSSRDTPHGPVRLAELLRNTLRLLGGSFKKTRAVVTFDVPDDIVLMGDEPRLQQVFINLLHNASMSGEGVTVRMTALPCGGATPAMPQEAAVVGDLDCYQRTDVRMAQIIISDSGEGIAPEALKRVFEPFYTSREPGHGMGLGLFIVQEIIKEHDGCMTIMSRKNLGTEVLISLPCAPEEMP